MRWCLCNFTMAEVFLNISIPFLASPPRYPVPCMSGHDAMTGPPEEKRKVECTLRGLEADRPQAGRRLADLCSHDIMYDRRLPSTARYLSHMYQAMEQIFEPRLKITKQ